MARKIPFKTTSLLWVKDEFGNPGRFGWAEQMEFILRQAPAQGFNPDQVLRSVEAMIPLAKAIEEEADCVTFTEDQYRTLRERLDGYTFRIADPALAEFILAIRNASEIT